MAYCPKCGTKVTEEMTFLAVAGRIHDVTRVRERVLEQPLQIVVVFDQENPHSPSRS